MTWYEWATGYIQWLRGEERDHERRIVSLENWRVKAMADLSDLQAEVGIHKAKFAALVAKVNDLAAKLEAAKNDPAAIDGIIAELKSEDAAADEVNPPSA